MSDEGLYIETDEQLERLHRARKEGDICAACGRAFGDDEAIYRERFRIAGTFMSYAAAPVGVECAPPELLDRTAGTEPERCAACGRSVYYGTARRRAACSKRCANRIWLAKRVAQRGATR